ncbi:hypothetical protein B0H67DRAFT_685930 [Lasiosphaeris hirsuta]|uniref:Uncharacterized protein n=1 Tax=Lasiosphaeris hirsuta TaxID=260670 RepID=A0AA40DPV2_9PEZI|nr:hypothetical protein B0H67DRAFT_685930 [Lasiosphaeris hirsuta]
MREKPGRGKVVWSPAITVKWRNVAWIRPNGLRFNALTFWDWPTSSRSVQEILRDWQWIRSERVLSGASPRLRLTSSQLDRLQHRTSLRQHPHFISTMNGNVDPVHVILITLLAPVCYIAIGSGIYYLRFGNENDWPVWLKSHVFGHLSQPVTPSHPHHRHQQQQQQQHLNPHDGGQNGPSNRTPPVLSSLKWFCLFILLLWPLCVVYALLWWAVWSVWAARYVLSGTRGGDKRPWRVVRGAKAALESESWMPMLKLCRRAMLAAERARRDRTGAGDVELGEMGRDKNGVWESAGEGPVRQMPLVPPVPPERTSSLRTTAGLSTIMEESEGEGYMQVMKEAHLRHTGRGRIWSPV